MGKCHSWQRCGSAGLSMCVSDPHLPSLVLTACLLVHKREARERREGTPSPAGSLLAALAKDLLWRKMKFLMKIRLPFTEARRSQLCFPQTHFLSGEDPPPKAVCYSASHTSQSLRRAATVFTPGWTLCQPPSNPSIPVQQHRTQKL